MVGEGVEQDLGDWRIVGDMAHEVYGIGVRFGASWESRLPIMELVVRTCRRFGLFCL